MTSQIVVAADPAAVDEDLRRGLNMPLGLEGIGLIARVQPPIVDAVPLCVAKEAGLQAIGTDMLGHYHAIERGGFPVSAFSTACTDMVANLVQLMRGVDPPERQRHWAISGMSIPCSRTYAR